MTLDEAIDIIRQYECCKEHYEACEMAIKALKKPEIIFCKGYAEGHANRDSEIIRCKDCKHKSTNHCPMVFEECVEFDDDGWLEHDYIIHDNTVDDGYCDDAERRTE